MKTLERKPINVGLVPANPRDITQWSREQIRLAGAWSSHEIRAMRDPLCAAYDWQPDWIGDMSAREVSKMVIAHYRGGAR